MYEAGTAKTDITAYKEGIGMMGYGMITNVVRGIETPLYARAFVFRNPESGRKFAFVVCEMAFVTLSIRSGVLKKLKRNHPELGFNEQNLILTAQHTHSGPGGYSHYGLYNITIPGFVPQVYQAIVAGITQAIVEANSKLKLACLNFGQAEFPEEVEVAFNRSMKAYLSNPDAKNLRPEQTHLALDREMKLLRIDGVDGSPMGSINWFGLHNTSIHNDNTNVNWDNKGYAADFMEKELRAESGNENYIAAFAQGNAGDVTPNHIYDKKKKWTRGPYEDDIESAKYSGRLQSDQAKEIAKAANQGVLGGIDYGIMNVNFANVACDPEFTGGKEGMRTGSACHGVAFFAGTKEGPGMDKIVSSTASGLSVLVKGYDYARSLFLSKEKKRKIFFKYKVHGKKRILFESGERKVLGSKRIKDLVFPGFVDKTIYNLKKLHPNGRAEDKPWVPHVLPLQIVTMGPLAFVSVPAETTTISGQRIAAVVKKEMEKIGIKQVVMVPYSNGYCGYITTREEYEHQLYEGGHTVFGQWTCAAFQTKFKQLAKEMAKKSEHRNIVHEAESPVFSPEELRKRGNAMMNS